MISVLPKIDCFSFVCDLGLFVICSKSNTEMDIHDAFSKFGRIEEVYGVKDRTTGDNRGKVLAYMRLLRDSFRFDFA